MDEGGKRMRIKKKFLRKDFFERQGPESVNGGPRLEIFKKWKFFVVIRITG